MKTVGEMKTIIRDMRDVNLELSRLYKELAPCVPDGIERKRVYASASHATYRAITQIIRLNKIDQLRQSIGWFIVPGR